MRKPKIKLVIMPFFRLGPPLGAACMQAYLEQFGFSLECLDLRLRKNSITTYTELTSEVNFAQDIPDLPLILAMIRNQQSGADLLAGFEEVLAEFIRTRPLSYLDLKSEIRDVYRLAAEAGPQLDDADIVGFTTYRSNFFATALCALLIRRLNRKAVFVLGGPQMSQSDNSRKLALKGGICDVAVVGEGEKALLEIVRAWLDGRPFAGSGIVTYERERDRFISGPAEVIDLNHLPCPDFSCMDIKKQPGMRYTNELPLYTSRGCPFSCSFCNEGRMWSSTFRQLPVEKVIDNMKEMNRRYGTFDFSFTDSLLNSSFPWLEEFCRQMINQGLDFKWGGYFRADITRELAGSMKRAGLTSAFIGAESFDGDLLQQMNKKRTTSDNVQAVENFLAEGVLLQISNVAGFPGETEDMFRNHWRFLLELTRRYPAQCFFNVESFQFSPGSDVYDQPQKYGIEVGMWGEEIADLVPELKEIVMQTPMTVSYDPSPAVTSSRFALLLNNFRRDSAARHKMQGISLAPLLKRRVLSLQPTDAIELIDKTLTLEPAATGGSFLIKSGLQVLHRIDFREKYIFSRLDGISRVREILAAMPETDQPEDNRLEIVAGFLEELIDAGILFAVQGE